MVPFVSPADLAAHVGTTPDGYVTTCTDATNTFCAVYPWLVLDGVPTPSARLGALMMAGRLWRRRNSLGGIEVLGDGSASYVARTDPDIARLLGIEQFATPRVG